MIMLPFLIALYGDLRLPMLPDGAAGRCAALYSPKLRRQVSAAASLEREVVLVPENPTDADMAVLASALHANAAKIGNVWHLTRSSAGLDALRMGDLEWLMNRVKASVARGDRLAQRFAKSPVEAPYRAMLAGQAAFEKRTEDRLDRSALDASDVTPGARLLVELLRQIPSDLLSKASPGKVTVFSNAPVGLERPVAVGQDILKAYAEGQKRFTEWSTEALAQGKIPDAYRWAFPKSEFRPGTRTLLLYVGRRELEPSFSLQIFDPTGHLEAGASLLSRDYEQTSGVERRDAPVLGRVSLSPETRIAIERATPGAPGFRIASLDPVANEPLDAVVREALLLWSKAKGHSRVVACVPDALLAVEGYIEGSILDLDALTRAIERAGCESLVKSGTLVVRPENPLNEEALRVDRRPLSALFLKVSKGSFNLNDLFEYHAAYASDYDHRSSLERMEHPIREAFELRSLSRTEPHPLLATLGKLPPSQRQALAAGGRVSLDSPNLSACLFSLAEYATYAGVSVGSDLDRPATRLLARPGVRFLEGDARELSTLVRRVSRGYTEFKRRDRAGNDEMVKGENILVDVDFVTPYSIAGLYNKNDAYRMLDQGFRFLWIQERPIQVRVVLGDVSRLGPFTIRERVGGSKTAVPLDQVPGLDRSNLVP